MKTGYFFDFNIKSMNKRLYLLLLACCVLLSAHAQLNGNGYYRVKNVASNRWMSLCDNTSTGVDYNSTTIDCAALVTNSIWDEISCDAGSIFYVESAGDKKYNIYGQGTSIYEMIQYYIYLTKVGSSYTVWQEQKGQRVLLSDKNTSKDKSYVINNTSYDRWNIIPWDNQTNYLGVKPTISAGGKHYAAFFAGFPYNLGAGMKAYYISKLDESKGVAVYKELTGTIPAKTPVIIECSSKEVGENLLTPVVSKVAVPSDHVAKGVYFCMGNPWSGHFNSTKFDEAKMRVLGVNADGKLVVTTSTEYLASVNIREEDSAGNNLSVLAIPANSWYLPVSVSAPTELELMSDSEYTTGIEDIVASPSKTTYDVYTIDGIQLKKNAKSINDLPQGIYIVNGKKVVIK